jgi:hypothetical protein
MTVAHVHAEIHAALGIVCRSPCQVLALAERLQANAADEPTCEACESGMRLTPDHLHYDDARGGATWGVCRKFVAKCRAERGEAPAASGQGEPLARGASHRVLLEVDFQAFQHEIGAATRALLDAIEGRECEANEGPAMALVRKVRVRQPSPVPEDSRQTLHGPDVSCDASGLHAAETCPASDLSRPVLYVRCTDCVGTATHGDRFGDWPCGCVRGFRCWDRDPHWQLVRRAVPEDAGISENCVGDDQLVWMVSEFTGPRPALPRVIADVVVRALRELQQRRREIADIAYCVNKLDDKPHQLFSRLRPMAEDDDVRAVIDYCYENIGSWLQQRRA